MIWTFLLKHWKLAGFVGACTISFYSGHYFTVVFQDAALAKKLKAEQRENQELQDQYNKLSSETATMLEAERNRASKLNQELSDAKKKYAGPNCTLPADGVQYLRNKAKFKVSN